LLLLLLLLHVNRWQHSILHRATSANPACASVGCAPWPVVQFCLLAVVGMVLGVSFGAATSQLPQPSCSMALLHHCHTHMPQQLLEFLLRTPGMCWV
jgi:hypothetical protein